MFRRMTVGAFLGSLLSVVVAMPGLAASPHAFVDSPVYSAEGAQFYWAKSDLFDALGLDLLTGYPGGTKVVDLARPFREEKTAPKVDFYVHMAPVIREVPAWGEVRPGSAITRAEFATMLARATGLESEFKEGNAAPFRDTPKNEWYQKYLSPLYERNVIRLTDYYMDTLKPNDPITRAEIAAWSTRALQALGKVTPGVDLAFTDIPPRYQYETELKQAVAFGIINGYPDGRFAPDNTANRAEAATMMMRMVRQLGTAEPDVEGLKEVIQKAHDVHTVYMKERPERIPDPVEYAKYMRPYWTASAVDLRVNPAPTSDNCKGVPFTFDPRFTQMRDYQREEGLNCVSQEAGFGDMLAPSLTENHMRNRLEAVWTYTTVEIEAVAPVAVTDRYALLRAKGFVETAATDITFAMLQFEQDYYLRKEGGLWKVSGQGKHTSNFSKVPHPRLRYRIEGMTLADF